MSIVSNSIINADAEARYLSPGELDQIKAFVTGGQRRLRVAQVLAEGRERIVKQAGGALFNVVQTSFPQAETPMARR